MYAERTKAKNLRDGDVIVEGYGKFDWEFYIEWVDTDSLGQVRCRNETRTSSYDPDEFVYVKRTR